MASASAGAGHPGLSRAGGGLLGLRQVDDPVALSGAAVAVLGLAAGGDLAAPDSVRAASSRYASWAAASDPALAARALDYGDVVVEPDDLAVTFVRAHERLADILAVGATPLVLGGDPVVSLPVLQVLSGKLRGRLGVIAFSGSYGVALDPVYGAASRWARALELGVLAPANLVLVGGRADPPDGPALRVLDELGAHTCSVADVAELGMVTVAQEALEAAAAGTEAVYVSVDLGVLEGAAEPIGLSARELAAGVAAVATTLLAAADICGVGRATGGVAPATVAARVAAELIRGVLRQLS
jgi:arginase family enzyme